MKKYLSSRLTVVYKIIIPTIWTLIITSVMIVIFMDTHSLMIFFAIVMLLPLWLFIRLKQVSYDDKNVYVYNWRTTKTYALKDVKAINEGNLLSLDPFFEIEIQNEARAVEKVDFMPRVSEQLNFLFTKEYTGHLFTLKTKIVKARQG